MGGKFQLQAQDSFFGRLGDLKNESHFLKKKATFNIGFKIFNIFRQHLFYGSYEKKVSVVALAKLLQHGVNNNDTRLQVRK